MQIDSQQNGVEEAGSMKEEDLMENAKFSYDAFV